MADEEAAADSVDADTLTAPDPQPDAARAELVKAWQARIVYTRAQRSAQFERMRRDMAFARGIQWPGQTSLDDPRYVVNITQRHVAQRTAALYAKNPTFVAERRQTLDFAEWDERPDSLAQAQQIVAAAAQNPAALDQPATKAAIALLEDIYEGSQRRDMMTGVAQTLEVLFGHEIGQQQPPFKQRMKALVRRTVTTGVGLMKLGYHRTFEPRPDDVDRVTDMTEQLAEIERLAAAADNDEARTQHEADAETLRLMLGNLKQGKGQISSEGLDFDFPPATSLLVDLNCRELEGFVGARWVAQEFLLTPASVREIYRVDIGSHFTAYSAQGRKAAATSDGEAGGPQPGQRTQEASEDDRAAVYEIYDKHTGLVYVLCEGYPDFLKQPEAPAVRLRRFWPFFVLTFNDVEDDSNVYPPSDVTLIHSQQIDINLARERLREHRDAARPDWVTAANGLNDKDAETLQSSGAFRILRIKGLHPNQRIADLLQPKPTAPIDPNLYQTAAAFNDILMTTGSQQANLGGTSGATATETSIAASSLHTSLESNVDDLDDFLTEAAQAAGDVLLLEMSAALVQRIAGPGASWPELSADELADNIYLTIRAGSSGRPNKAQEVQNIERLAPFMLQIPGIDPHWLLEQLVHRLDDKLDVSDAYLAGAPSIIAQNSAKQPSTGDPASDPAQQGGQGNAPPRAPGGDTNMGPNNAATGAPATGSAQMPATAPVRQP